MQRDPAAPPELDGYTAVRVIGVGGFSDVFLYVQELPRRQVAVKVLSGELNDEVRAAFVREANLMAALSTHPYIVTIHHAGIAADGRPYLVMEYCSRPSLAERYKRQPLSVADALRTGIRIAGAVATLHGAGILHRDIKPANVLTNDYGWPALTDFGIATVVGETGDPSTIGLSVPWSPPEMFVDAPDPDARSDVFSLAATLFTALAGRTPFEVRGGPNGQLELIGRIERGEVTPMTRTDLPASLQAALARGMAPRREDRWQSALEFAQALQRVELELGYAPTGIELPSGDGGAGDREPGVGEPRDDDATRMRVAPAIVLPRPAPGDAPQREGRRRPLAVVLVVGGLAVLAIAAIVIAILLGGAGQPGSGEATPARTGGSAVGATIPQPTAGAATASADGTSVAFTWGNPSPEPGDSYYWARSETPDDRQVTSQSSAVVTGVIPGSRVCIDVALGRSGRTSSPERICTAP